MRPGRLVDRGWKTGTRWGTSVPQCPQTGVVTLSIAVPLGAPNLIATAGRDAFVTNRPTLPADRIAVAIHLFVFLNPFSHLPRTLSAQ